MTVHVLERAQVIARPVDEVFPFFARASNLERITPSWLRFRLVGSKPAEMGVGTRLEYLLHVHGVPLRWISRIDAWEPGRCFVDRQIRGPYALWVHTHVVEAHPGGTLSRDRVRYALPLGPLGEVAHRLLIRGDLERIFDYRHQAVARLLG